MNNPKQKMAQVSKGQQIKEESRWQDREKEREKGKERINKQKKKKIESSLSSYSVMCINREVFKDKHKWYGFNVTF